MAQTIDYWQQLIISELAGNGIAVSGSRTSIRRIWTRVVAFAMWTLDVLFDLRKKEVTDIIATQKPHRELWYKTKALAFQYGHDLESDEDTYDNTGYTDQQISDSKIITYAAVKEVIINNRSLIIVKVATEINGKLAPLSAGQLAAFIVYIADIKDAGVVINVINYLPDLLYLNMQVYYNPLVLSADGSSILNGGKPVEEAINQYLKELPFNGELILAHLVDRLQLVEGVDIPVITSAESKWIDGNTDNYGAVQTINVKRIPESGYFEIVNFNGISYVANV